MRKHHCSNLRGCEYEPNPEFRFQSVQSDGNVAFTRLRAPSKTGIVPPLGLTAEWGIFFCLQGHSGQTGALLIPFFEYSGESSLRSVPFRYAPSPSKAHVQTARAGVTSGAQDFENVEKFGHRYLNRADSENHPAKDSETEHSSATRQACPSLRSYGRQVERRCCDCDRLKQQT